MNGFETKQDEMDFNYGLSLIYKTINDMSKVKKDVKKDVKKTKASDDKKINYDFERIIMEKQELGEYIEYNNILLEMEKYNNTYER